MSETAATQLRRILALIPRLADGEEHPVAELATALGVSASDLIDDIGSLVERYDVPGGFVQGVQVYLDHQSVSAATPHFLRPMRLTLSELCALELGLALARRERAPDEVAAVDSALERLRAVMTRVPSDHAAQHDQPARVAELGGAWAAPAHLRAFRDAIRSRRKVSLTYLKGGATAADVRTICPYSLAYASGAWYAVAHCERTEAVRFFRLDRVVEMDVLLEMFEVPAGYSAQGILREGRVFSGEAARSVRIRYSPRIARWVAERAGASLAADGSLELEHLMADVSWAVRHALQYGAEAEVLGPPEAREAMVKALASLAGR